MSIPTTQTESKLIGEVPPLSTIVGKKGAPYYTQWFGTVWAMISDVTDRRVGICFGSPGYNDWHVFDLGGAPGMVRYEATFAQKQR